MKISLEWLSQSLPGPLNARELGERLTHAGLPVENFLKHGEDDVLDVEVTSNRSDCLCHIGVARELAAILNRKVVELKPPPASAASPSNPAAATPVSVSIESPDLSPH